MDLLPIDNSQIAKKHGFRSLKLVNVDLDQDFQHQPFGVDYGRLDNGLTYYVRSNPKPRLRAALALAVKVGLVSPPFHAFVQDLALFRDFFRVFLA